MSKKEDKKITPFGTEILKGTNERVKVGFDEDGKIKVELENYSDRIKIPYPQSSGIENLLDARGQMLKFWYEKNPTTDELLWSIGIDGLDENRLIKTKTMLTNASVFVKLVKIGMDYYFKNEPVNPTKKQIEDILNEKTGFGLSTYLLKFKVITEKVYRKKFKLKHHTARKQLKRFEKLKLIKAYGINKGRVYKLHIEEEALRKVLLV